MSKRKIEGGLNLINLTEHINSLKIKQILEADTQIPETDNIIYTIGTKDKIIYDGKISGPKKEKNTEEEERLIKKIVDNEISLKNYKKRHKQYRTKDIQNMIYPKRGTIIKKFFEAKEPKLVSRNYQMVHNYYP